MTAYHTRTYIISYTRPLTRTRARARPLHCVSSRSPQTLCAFFFSCPCGRPRAYKILYTYQNYTRGGGGRARVVRHTTRRGRPVDSSRGARRTTIRTRTRAPQTPRGWKNNTHRPVIVDTYTTKLYNVRNYIGIRHPCVYSRRYVTKKKINNSLILLYTMRWNILYKSGVFRIFHGLSIHIT